MTEETLFAAALEQAPTERQAYLEMACGGDAVLLKRLRALLAAHDKAVGVLEQPAGVASPSSTVDQEFTGDQVGTVIAGRYKLLEQIGEGGMGTVWVAEQTEPVRRKVALKLIKPGMDSKSVLARFEAERQALAMMDHPNIAKVLDGGVTDTGRPFFAMEYVRGIRLTKYCDDARLSVAERLALFVPVCQAVQHAHQKGVIHRDLKPSNILVCLYDGVPVPKVIDFGLAKAMHQPLTEHTLHTAHGTMMGTPLYMSPEQAEFNNLDVDTRTDIYSLGVILYELLTGSTPLERQRFKEAAWFEMLRLIKEEEPPKPSARLSGSGTLPSIAAQRKLEPAKLTKLVRGELDWIVMKALEKDRSRRFETANAFARDIQRYLADEPVEACPPSRSYRLRKFARKNWAALSTVSAIVLILASGVGVSTWLAIRAMEAEDQAAVDRDKAQKQEAEALKQAGIAKGNEVRATKASAEKQAALDELKYNAALDRILLAQAAYDSGNVPVARERLEQVSLDLRRWEWHYMNRLNHGGIFTLHGHSGTVWCAVFSPDGARIATSSSDNSAKIWDARTGVHLLDFKGHTEKVKSVAFSPNGMRLATGSNDKTVRIWNARTALLELELRGFGTWVDSVAFSSDGARIVTASGRAAKVWDAGTGKVVLELKGHDDFVLSAVYSPDGSRIATGSHDGIVKVWDALTGAHLIEIKNRPIENKWSYFKVAFSPEGDRLVTGTNSQTAKVWNARTGEFLLELKGHTSLVTCSEFSPDGRRIATGCWDGTARVWDAQTGAQLVELKGHSHAGNRIINWISFSPDGMRLVTGSNDQTAKVWDAHTGTPVLTFKGHDDVLSSVAFSPEGKRVLTSSTDYTARLWNVNTAALQLELKGHSNALCSAVFSPDGERIATSSFDGTARLWDAQNGTSLLELKGHTNTVPSVDFSPDGKQLVTASVDKTARVWDTHNGAVLFELKGHTSPVISALFSRDGKRIVTGDYNGIIKVWDAQTSAFQFDLKNPKYFQLNSMTFSADGTRLAVAAFNTATIWNMQTGAVSVELKGHFQTVWCVAFSPDGTRIATGSYDHTAKIWDVQTGTPLIELKAHNLEVRGVAFSPDGQRLATAGRDRVVKIWDARGLDAATEGPLTPDARNYRLFWTRPRPDLHWEAYDKSVTAKGAFASAFHLERLSTHYKQAVILDPNDAHALAGLGEVHHEKKDLDGAIAKYRRAIELDPELRNTYKKLAIALIERNEPEQAALVFRQLTALHPENKRLVAYLGAYKRHDSVARLLATVFSTDPSVADDIHAAYRYDAACYAARAAAGDGRAARELTETDRDQMRRLALDWLRDDLAAYARIVDVRQKDMSPSTVFARLRRWKTDSDLAAIRDDKAIAVLPHEDGEACRKLWAEVEALLLRSQERMKADAAVLKKKSAKDTN